MKRLSALTSCTVLAMVSCETMNGLDSMGGFDPLGVPGTQAAPENFGGPQRIRPGEFVVATIDNTAFYNQRPGAEAEADKLLKRGTSMKVISTSGSFYRVELDDGAVGFVPSVMVESSNAMPAETDTAAFQLYPTDVIVGPEPPLPDLPSDILPDVIEPELEPEVAPESPPEAPTPDI